MAGKEARVGEGVTNRGRGDTPTRRETGRDTGSARRTKEAVGIATLATALLSGLSLGSVQLGDGMLMGPVGQAAGRGVNWALGLSGYVLVAVMLFTAVRIFAEAVGEREPTVVAASTRWRRRIGGLIGMVFVAMALHLIVYPRQIAYASAGGVVGEYGAELLSAGVSRVGTWIIVLSGLALSITLGLGLSLVEGVLRGWAVVAGLAKRASTAVLGLPRRFATAYRWMGTQLSQIPQREELVAESGGTATLPRILRLTSIDADIGDNALSAPTAPARSRFSRRPRQRKDVDEAPTALPTMAKSSTTAATEVDAPAVESNPFPAVVSATTLLRGASERPDTAATANTAQHAPSSPPAEVTPTTTSTPGPQVKAEATTSPDAAPALTIVQATFRKAEQDQPAETETEARQLESNAETGFVLNGPSYRLPPLSLLEMHQSGDHTPVDEQAIAQQAARLTKTLADYKIFGQVTEVHPGPVVTMYEFVPAPGTRVSKVAGLSNDLAMSLHAQRVRIVAPIPGKGAIGIEVPNGKREVVSFKEIVADESFRGKANAARQNSRASLKLALGKNIVGAPIVMDLAKAPHLLVAGATGAGKSVSVNAMICSLLLRCTPEEVRLILIDPKFLELSGYNDIPHLLLPVVTDPKQAAIALRWAVAEMERRYQLLADMRVRDIASFNRKIERMRHDSHDTAAAEEAASDEGVAVMTEAAPAAVTRVNTAGEQTDATEATETAAAPAAESSATANDEGDTARAATQPQPETKRRRSGTSSRDIPERMPYLVVVIDEFADLMMCSSKDVETCVARLAQKARACGIHLIVATQRPSVDVITGLIKANFPSRVAFQVASTHDSKTILGAYGAENLLGAGDMLVLDRGVEMRRVHGAYISDDEIHHVIDWVREQGRPVYQMDILKDDSEQEQTRENDEPVDALYDEAVAVVAESQQASISMVQRRLRIGYNRAARLIERMEQEGIVGPPDGVRGREVLIQHLS